MSELEQQTPQKNPIASLHRMSTTAGIAMQDYVAINNLAVVSAVMGLATALAFLATPFLLVGATGLVFGFYALRQIRNSNGTQTGKGFAWLGIVLSLVLAGGVGANAVRMAMAFAEHKQSINSAIAELGKHLMAGDYETAYNQCDPTFQSAVTRQHFQQVWEVQQDAYGKLVKLEGNNAFGEFAVVTDRLIVETAALIRFQKYSESRLFLVYRQGPDGKWRLYRCGDWFDGRSAKSK